MGKYLMKEIAEIKSNQNKWRIYSEGIGMPCIVVARPDTISQLFQIV